MGKKRTGNPGLMKLLTTKDGREVSLRPVELSDAADMLVIDRLTTEDGRGMVRSPEDLPADVDTMREELRSWTSGAFKEPWGCCFVAELGGRVVGYSEIKRPKARLVSHVAFPAIAIHPEYQGLGLGQLLMEVLIDWAPKESSIGPVRRLELYVRADNNRAIKLYEKLGFVLEAVRKDFILELDGRFVDDHIMVRFLSPSGSSADT